MKRLGAEVPDEYYEFVDQLMSACGAMTQKEFLQGAIAITQWAIEERRAGRTVGSLDDARRSFKQYDHNFLNAAFRKGQKPAL